MSKSDHLENEREMRRNLKRNKKYFSVTANWAMDNFGNLGSRVKSGVGTRGNIYFESVKSCHFHLDAFNKWVQNTLKRIPVEMTNQKSFLSLQKNGGCFFPSYHAQKQNLAESETKDFDLVTTIASTEGSKKRKKKKKEKETHWIGYTGLPLLSTGAHYMLLGRESHAALCPGKSAFPEAIPKRPMCWVRFFYPPLIFCRVLLFEELFHI